jgi:hypothetical protein
MEWLILVIGAFLLIASIIDWKVKKLPSIMLTAMLFAVAMLNPANLWFGIMTFILAFLLYEAGFFSGMADVKILTMLGFMVSTTNWLFALILLSVCFGFVWKVFVKIRLPKEKDCAFIPVFLFVYITLILLGGIS